MTRVDERRRSRFIQDLPSIDLSSSRRPRALEDLDVDSFDFNGDHVVEGDEEIGALFDHLLSLDPARPEKFLDSFRTWSETEARAAFIAALPSAGEGRGREPVQAFLDAIDARANGATKPEGVPDHVWAHAGAAHQQGVTADDARSFLVNGSLNDADLASIEQGALQDGDWAAVNTLTFLVSLRRSSVSSQAELVRADLAEDPALSSVVADAEAYDAELKSTLDTIYEAATIARERKAAIAIDRALASDDVDALDDASALAVAEAEYRERMAGTGWDASSAFELAAEAKILRAQISGDPADLEAATDLLTRADGARGGKAKTADRFAIEMAFQQTRGALASQRTGAGARREVAEARVLAAAAALKRLETYPATPRSPLERQRAADAAADARRALTDLAEMTGAAAYGQARATDAEARSAALSADLEASAQSLADTRQAVAVAKESLTQAESDASAMFGDTFKTAGQARRDREGISDAKQLVELESVRLSVAEEQHARLEVMAADASAEVSAASAAAAQGRMDARFVREALIAHPAVADASVAIDDLHRSVQAAADDITTRELALLEQAAEGRAADTLAIAARRIEIARSEVRATELLGAIDDRGGATARLDRADELLDLADTTRTGLKPRSGERQWLATMSIDARAALAQTEGDYRNGRASELIDEAASIARSDLTGAAREAADLRIGSAATFALVRADARLDEIIETGGYWSTANDSLYRSAHELLDGKEGDAVDLLERVDASLDAVGVALQASNEQVRAGHLYTDARLGALSRAEIGAAHAQMSIFETVGVQWVSLGWEDPKEDVALETEQAALERLSTATDPAVTMIVGGRMVEDAWESARVSDRSFEMLGAMRVLAAEDTSGPASVWTQSAKQTMRQHAPREYGKHSDWEAFHGRAIVDGQVPAASALRGPLLGVPAANDALAAHDLVALTPEMRTALDDQTASLMATTDGMGLRIAANLTVELGAGLLLGGPLGGGAVVAEGAATFNTARSAISAMQALRSVGMLARTGRVLSAIRNSRVAYTALTTTATGIGMTGAQMGLERLVGRNSQLAQSFGSVASIAPVMVGQRAAGLYSAASKSSAGRQFATQLALGGAQIHVGVLATDPIAEGLGVKSETGKAAIGITLDTLMSTGLAAGASRRARMRTDVDAMRAESIAGDRPNVEAVLREEIPALRRQIEHDPTPVDYDGLRTRLETEAGLSPRDVESVVDAVRGDVIDRAIVTRLEELTLASAEPTTPQIREVIQDTALRGRMSHADAAVLATDLSESKGMRDWVRATALGQDFSTMSNAERQADFLRRYPGSEELAKLTPDQFVEAFGEGPYTYELADLGNRPGFAAYAIAEPDGARSVYAGVLNHGTSDINSRSSWSWDMHAAAFEGRYPQRTVSVTATRGRHKGEPVDYHVIDGTRDPAMPALRMTPSRTLDHNGAFHKRGVRDPGLLHKKPVAPTEFADTKQKIKPAQLVLGRNPDGSPIRGTQADLQRVAVWAGHGAPDGFSGVSTEQAARMMATEIASHNASAGTPIEFVLLRSCSQGTRRGPLGLTGKTNAAVFQEALNAELGRLGHGPVDVLAAEKPGIMYGGRYSQYMKARPGAAADHVTPDQQRWAVAPETVHRSLKAGAILTPAALGAGALGAGGGYLVYTTVRDHQERAERQRKSGR